LSELITVRTDASFKIGSGHVMRCLTLAEELRSSGAEVEFVCREHSGNLIDLIRQKEFIVHDLLVPENFDSECVSENNSENEYQSWLGTSQEQDAQETITVIQNRNPEWMIVDHYAMGQAWESQLRPHVRKIMVIDDLADRPHDCDLLLDQNYFIDGESRYQSLLSPTCTKLLGPQFALLRPEFAEARKHLKPHNGKVQRVFVFFGGTDPNNITGKALEALSFPELNHLKVDVVIGTHNPHRAEIEQQVKSRLRTQLHVQVENMAELMAQSDLALGAGGATTWERLCLGLPTLVVTIAENQIPFSECLHHDGYLRWMGALETLDVQKLRQTLHDAVEQESINHQQSQKGKEIVSGDGTPQVAKLMTNGISSESWEISNAIASDCELYWHWVNDPEVGQSAFNSESIIWEEHQKWFNEKLNDPSTTLYLVESTLGPIGQVRFKKFGQHFIISYSISRQFRGLVLGREFLTVVIEVFHESHRFSLIGEVKESNRASAKVFEKFKFQELPSPPREKRNETLLITVLSDSGTWMNHWISELLAVFVERGHRVNWVHRPDELPEGDLCFLLSCCQIVKKEALQRNRNNLVVHASALPKGKGWSPLTWQILEGISEIPVTLFEAKESVDSGEIYSQDVLNFSGHELIDELREALADCIVRMCCQFIETYPEILKKAQSQEGTENFYKKRNPEDSRLDPKQSIAEQINLLRIVDNERYPAFFEWQGQRYVLRIEKCR
jgi:UDP-2,4-diacetamido-2,4,6-trideoxy-beta-L-altropyranose hydrolase